MRACSLALLIPLAGCVASTSIDRVQTVYARVEPSDAILWIDDGVERRAIGHGNVRTERVRETHTPGLGCSDLLPLAIFSSVFASLIASASVVDDLHGANTAGGIAFVSGVGFAAAIAVCFAYASGQVDTPARIEVIGASRRGYQDESRQLPPVREGRRGGLIDETVRFQFRLLPEPGASPDITGDQTVGLRVADLVDDSGLLPPALRADVRDRFARSVTFADERVKLVRDPARGASRTLVTHLFSMNGTCVLSAAEVDLESETVGRAASISIGCGALAIQAADLDQLAVMLAHGKGGMAGRQ